MEIIQLSISSQLKDSMEESLGLMGLTLNEFLEKTFSKEEFSTKTKTASQSSIVDLFQGFEENYQGESYDWGAPVGEEIW